MGSAESMALGLGFGREREARERDERERERGKIGYELFPLHAAPYTRLCWGAGSSGLLARDEQHARHQRQVRAHLLCGSGCRVQGAEFRVQGLEFRV
jgi:hypothetical protein